MNERMRRYLDEDEEQEPSTGVRPVPRKTTKQPVLDRRQKDKEWGRAMAKFHKERKKDTVRPDKP